MKKLILIFFVIIVSCKTDEIGTKPVEVPASFQPYLDRFLADAKARGVDINLAKKGIIVKYSSLESRDAAGLCTYKSPNEITIDPTSWLNSTESYKEFLIYHELGHCVLNRRHRNDVLPNGEWTSIMRGSPETPGRTWTTNFNGFRKNYYLDELFNDATATPAFAKVAPSYNSFSNQKKEIIYINDFSDNDKKWQTGQFNEYNASIENGFYNFQRKNNAGLVGINVKIDTTKNFEIEAEIKINAASNYTGLVFGSDREEDVTFLLYKLNRSSIFGQNLRYNDILLSQITTPQIKTGVFNKFTIRKVDGQYFIYINEHFFYTNEFLGLKTDFIGLFTSGTTSLQLDNFKVSYLL